MGFKADLRVCAEAGGWLRYGIPEYRLPKAILRKELENSPDGVKIHCNTPTGLAAA
jgi:formate dehydrogenase major subunit